MLVKDIIKNSATLIGREDVVSYLDGEEENASETTVNTVDVMVRLLNLVVNELAGSFIPLIVRESVSANGGKIYYSSLNYSPREILGAFDGVGKNRLLSIENTFARVDSSVVEIEYSCFPNAFTLNDSLAYQEKDVPSRVLSYGLLAEYAISQGCFKDAVLWHDRYADAITELCKPKNVNIKRRNWA